MFMRILIILAVSLAAYAAYGQTSVRPNRVLGGYDVYQNGRIEQNIRPNPLTGGYDVYSGGRPSAIIRPNPLMGGYEISPLRPAPYAPVTPRPLPYYYGK